MTENELIQQAKQGDAAALDALYRRHSSRVYTVVRRLSGDDAQAEDAAQETWLRAMRALPSFRGQAMFSTWLHRIAVNCALYGRRKRERNRTREIELPETLQPAAPEGRPLLRMRLEEAIDQLPEGMRRVLVLHDIEGYTHEEIGDLLGVAAGTCKSQLFKARAKMRAYLRQTVEGEEVCSI
jgi:RNA polymerase sigma-70 factor (ECF subfamily)